MKTHSLRSLLSAVALSAGSFTAPHAHATVFEDAYECLKANAQLTLLTAEMGPKAVEFVVTQPQCVALVTSPAPVPTSMMVATLGLTASGTLPRNNPACEGSLYTAAAKPVAAILDQVGILPASIKKMLADQAATEAVGQAVQNIPGASVAFASFSCGCGLSDVGLNPPKIAQIFNAIKATGSKCSAVLGNLMEGGSEAIVAGVSNVGDVLAGQSQHVDPQVYFKHIFVPRLMADYERHQSNWYGVDINLSKTTVPQCEHYFDKHTMSAANASKTCVALSSQYLALYKQSMPILAEKSLMGKLRTGYTPISHSFESDKTKPGMYCTAAAAKTYPKPGTDPARSRYMEACLADMAQYYGYDIKPDTSYSSQNRYFVKKISDQQWTTRIVAAANNPGGLKASQVLEKVQGQIMGEWQKQEAQKSPGWIAKIDAELATADAKKNASEAAFKEQGKKKQAEDKVAADKAAAERLAQATAGCKDERCKAETAEWMAACKPYGTESSIMQGQLACQQNLGVTVDISVIRAEFNAQLEWQVKKVLSVVCPPTMDCSTGVTNQRAEIEAQAVKAWDYGRDQALKRALVADSRKAVVKEVTQMIAPLKARQVVAENKPKTRVADIDPKKGAVAGYNVPPSPVQVLAPPKVDPSTPVKPIGALPPTPHKAPPANVVAAPPKVEPTTPVKPVGAAAPTPYKPPPAAMMQNTPPAPSAPVATPITTAKLPAGFGTAAAGVGAGTASPFPKAGTGHSSLGQATPGATKVEGCSPRGAQDPTTLVCEGDAALNRCRSLLVSGRVKACLAR